MNKKNELNVLKYSYYKLRSFYAIWANIRQFCRNIKYAYQRIVRGYCECDVWDLDDFLLCIIRDSVEELANTNHGYPIKSSEDEWDKILHKISVLANECREENPIWTSKYEEVWAESEELREKWLEDCQKLYEERKAKIKELYELLAEHHVELWD